MNEQLIGRQTPIHIRKYDGSYHRRWPARFVMQKGPLYLLAFDEGELIGRAADPDNDPRAYPARFGGDVYLYEDRWYNVSRMLREGRTWFYVNVATPAEFDGDSFATIDLDLDISWYTDAAPEVLDEDEFLAHREAMRYPADVVAHARAAVDEVLGLIRQRAFPFDRP